MNTNHTLTEEQQWRQEEHDRLFHFDIYTLSKHHRLAHLTLHMAKYNGKLLQAIGDVSRVQGVCVDAFIVMTSILNTLGHSLGDKEIAEISYGANVDYAIRPLVIETGKLCKVVEAIDHLEYIDIRKTSLEIVTKLLSVWLFVWVETSGTFEQLSQSILERLIQVEQKNIFYRQIVEENPHLGANHE